MSKSSSIEIITNPLSVAPITTRVSAEMWRQFVVVGLAFTFFTPSAGAALGGFAPAAPQEESQESASPSSEELESQFFTDVKQRTRAGLRSGEGYYSADGNKMVFQSERSADNPFYQIYLMDFELGDVDRISPGIGKTTCAWIHPNDELVMFASTHGDPRSVDLQNAKLKQRAEGKEPRYSWDYDENYEIYSYNLKTKEYQQLTDAVGYDAEGSYSPDGSKICFASNRRAYAEGALTDREKSLVEAYGAQTVMDLYLMDSDGSNVVRITDEDGYDGGPFFSADGKKICWRRFVPGPPGENYAEIWTMNLDGSDKRCLTDLKAVSFAPYFHPSGEYLLFMSDFEGFFEIYMIPTSRKAKPIRVTHTNSFNGFPVFSTDGKSFSWTSSRADRRSQVFTADWDHEASMKAIGKAPTLDEDSSNNVSEAQQRGAGAGTATSEKFVPEDVLRHVDYLCRPELGGRMTGSLGERKATAYVAAYLDSLGFEPAGDLNSQTGERSWFQEFDFPSGAKLGDDNSLSITNIKSSAVPLNEDWRPLTFSENGTVEGPLVFAGYGMKAPKTDDLEEYDSYVHLPVEGKWVMVFRYMPEDVPVSWRTQRALQSQLRVKAATIRDLGGLGMIIVSGPKSNTKQEVIPLSRDAALGKISIPVISISDDIAGQLMKSAGQDLGWWQNQLDNGDLKIGFEFPDVRIKANVDVEQIRGRGRNVIGRLQFEQQPTDQCVVVGAHIDHLGTGVAGSMARDDEKGQIHRGADDNASGVAAMLEVAQFMSAQKRSGKITAGRDLVIAGWSGEELGLHGSNHFVDAWMKSYGKDVPVDGGTSRPSLQDRVVAYLNMDMVGRFDGKLVLQGLGSSDWWESEIEKRNLVVGLNLQTQKDTNLPTDASEFYQAGVPILAAFTGSHKDYHTPRDTPDKLNYDKAAEIAKLMGLITRSLVVGEETPVYQVHNDEQSSQRMSLRVSLGTSPDYTAELKGVMLKAIRTNSPADKAGVKPQDVVVELAGIAIENVYDYTNVIGALKPGETIKIAVLRKGERLEMEITPE